MGRSLIVPITVRVRGINPGAVSCSGTDVFREAITTGWNESRPKSVSQRLRARVNATWTVGAFTSSHLHFVCTDVTPDLAELAHRGQSQLIRVEAPPQRSPAHNLSARKLVWSGPVVGCSKPSLTLPRRDLVLRVHNPPAQVLSRATRRHCPPMSTKAWLVGAPYVM